MGKTLKKRIKEMFEADPELSIYDLEKKFPDRNFEYLRRCLSNIKKEERGLGKPKKITKITMEILEPLIARRLEHNPNNADLKLAVEVLKIKQQDTGLMQDIDLEKFYKKGMEEDEQD